MNFLKFFGFLCFTCVPQAKRDKLEKKATDIVQFQRHIKSSNQKLKL